MNSKYNQFNPTPYEAHMVVYEKIKEGSKVLDVGCATGYFAQKLKEKDCKVWGIEMDKKAAILAKPYCEEVIVEDIEKIEKLPKPRNFYDYILFLDVLEHLKYPDKIIQLLKPYLKKDGKIIISVPNIAHISIRLRLLLGSFDYERVGIMDETHLRFFTKKTLQEFIKQAGLKLVELEYSSDFGQLPFVGRIAKKMPKIMQYKLTKSFPGLLAVQLIAVCSL